MTWKLGFTKNFIDNIILRKFLRHAWQSLLVLLLKEFSESVWLVRSTQGGCMLYFSIFFNFYTLGSVQNLLVKRQTFWKRLTKFLHRTTFSPFANFSFFFFLSLFPFFFLFPSFLWYWKFSYYSLDTHVYIVFLIRPLL